MVRMHNPRTIEVETMTGTATRLVFRLLDLYTGPLASTAIAKDAVDEVVNNQDSTTRRIARARLAAIAGLGPWVLMR